MSHIDFTEPPSSTFSSSNDFVCEGCRQHCSSLALICPACGGRVVPKGARQALFPDVRRTTMKTRVQTSAIAVADRAATARAKRGYAAATPAAQAAAAGPRRGGPGRRRRAPDTHGARDRRRGSNEALSRTQGPGLSARTMSSGGMSLGASARQAAVARRPHTSSGARRTRRSSGDGEGRERGPELHQLSFTAPFDASGSAWAGFESLYDLSGYNGAAADDDGDGDGDAGADTSRGANPDGSGTGASGGAVALRPMSSTELAERVPSLRLQYGDEFAALQPPDGAEDRHRPASSAEHPVFAPRANAARRPPGSSNAVFASYAGPHGTRATAGGIAAVIEPPSGHGGNLGVEREDAAAQVVLASVHANETRRAQARLLSMLTAEEDRERTRKLEWKSASPMLKKKLRKRFGAERKEFTTRFELACATADFTANEIIGAHVHTAEHLDAAAADEWGLGVSVGESYYNAPNGAHDGGARPASTGGHSGGIGFGHRHTARGPGRVRIAEPVPGTFGGARPSTAPTTAGATAPSVDAGLLYPSFSLAEDGSVVVGAVPPGMSADDAKHYATMPPRSDAPPAVPPRTVSEYAARYPSEAEDVQPRAHTLQPESMFRAAPEGSSGADEQFEASALHAAHDYRPLGGVPSTTVSPRGGAADGDDGLGFQTSLELADGGSGTANTATHTPHGHFEFGAHGGSARAAYPVHSGGSDSEDAAAAMFTASWAPEAAAYGDNAVPPMHHSVAALPMHDHGLRLPDPAEVQRLAYGGQPGYNVHGDAVDGSGLGALGSLRASIGHRVIANHKRRHRASSARRRGRKAASTTRSRPASSFVGGRRLVTASAAELEKTWGIPRPKTADPVPSRARRGAPSSDSDFAGGATLKDDQTVGTTDGAAAWYAGSTQGYYASTQRPNTSQGLSRHAPPPAGGTGQLVGELSMAWSASNDDDGGVRSEDTVGRRPESRSRYEDAGGKSWDGAAFWGERTAAEMLVSDDGAEGDMDDGLSETARRLATRTPLVPPDDDDDSSAAADDEVEAAMSSPGDRATVSPQSGGSSSPGTGAAGSPASVSSAGSFRSRLQKIAGGSRAGGTAMGGFGTGTSQRGLASSIRRAAVSSEMGERQWWYGYGPYRESNDPNARNTHGASGAAGTGALAAKKHKDWAELAAASEGKMTKDQKALALSRAMVMQVSRVARGMPARRRGVLFRCVVRLNPEAAGTFARPNAGPRMRRHGGVRKPAEHAVVCFEAALKPMAAAEERRLLQGKGGGSGDRSAITSQDLNGDGLVLRVYMPSNGERRKYSVTAAEMLYFASINPNMRWLRPWQVEEGARFMKRYWENLFSPVQGRLRAMRGQPHFDRIIYRGCHSVPIVGSPAPHAPIRPLLIRVEVLRVPRSDVSSAHYLAAEQYYDSVLEDAAAKDAGQVYNTGEADVADGGTGAGRARKKAGIKMARLDSAPIASPTASSEQSTPTDFVGGRAASAVSAPPTLAAAPTGARSRGASVTTSAPAPAPAPVPTREQNRSFARRIEHEAHRVLGAQARETITLASTMYNLKMSSFRRVQSNLNEKGRAEFEAMSKIDPTARNHDIVFRVTGHYLARQRGSDGVFSLTVFEKSLRRVLRSPARSICIARGAEAVGKALAEALVLKASPGWADGGYRAEYHAKAGAEAAEPATTASAGVTPDTVGCGASQPDEYDPTYRLFLALPHMDVPLGYTVEADMAGLDAITQIAEEVADEIVDSSDDEGDDNLRADAGDAMRRLRESKQASSRSILKGGETHARTTAEALTRQSSQKGGVQFSAAAVAKADAADAKEREELKNSVDDDAPAQLAGVLSADDPLAARRLRLRRATKVRTGGLPMRGLLTLTLSWDLPRDVEGHVTVGLEIVVTEPETGATGTLTFGAAETTVLVTAIGRTSTTRSALHRIMRNRDDELELFALGVVSKLVVLRIRKTGKLSVTMRQTPGGANMRGRLAKRASSRRVVAAQVQARRTGSTRHLLSL